MGIRDGRIVDGLAGRTVVLQDWTLHKEVATCIVNVINIMSGLGQQLAEFGVTVIVVIYHVAIFDWIILNKETFKRVWIYKQDNSSAMLVPKVEIRTKAFYIVEFVHLNLIRSL